MAESPLAKLGRLVGGIVLMQGRLGHQSLGQMLLLGNSDLEIAGATVTLAASSGQENAFLDAAIRTAVPALAVNALARKRERQLERLANTLAEKDQELAALDKAFLAREAGLRTRQADLDSREAQVTAAEARIGETQQKVTSLEDANQKLTSELEGLREHLSVMEQQLLSTIEQEQPHAPAKTNKPTGPTPPKGRTKNRPR